MATPFDLRFLSSKTGSASATAPGAHGPSGRPVHASSDYAISQRGAGRHPVGLIVVVGLHVLLAAVLLTARLNAGPPQLVQVELKKIDEVRPPPPKPQDLPNPPRSTLRQIVVPVPEVVVDPPVDAIQGTRQEAPAAPPAVAGPAVAKGDDGGSSMLRSPYLPARIDAGDAKCRPRYPHIAEREGVTGITRLRFTVDAAGRVSAQLLESSGPLRENRRMDQAAIEALSQCPVQVGTDERGRPIGGTVDVNYKWTIN